MNAEERSFKHAELTRKIIGVFLQVYGELGYGFLESVYRSAMAIALTETGLVVEPEVKLHARFRGRSIGTFRADLLVEGAVLVELKAARSIDSAHIAQLLNYLRCTVVEVAQCPPAGVRKPPQSPFDLPQIAAALLQPCVHLRSSAFICGPKRRASTDAGPPLNREFARAARL